MNEKLVNTIAVIILISIPLLIIVHKIDKKFTKLENRLNTLEKYHICNN